MIDQIRALEALLARVKRASGPSREIDAWVHLIFVNEGRTGVFESPEAWVRFAVVQKWNTGRYTSSLEAGLHLVRHILPGAMWAVGCMEGGPFCRLVYPTGLSGGWGHTVSMEQEGGPDSEPLAILCCLISARLALLTAGATGARKIRG